MSNPLRCVIDANVGIKRFIADPLTPKVNQLLAHSNISDAEIYIPDLFYIELTNIFWKYVRAGMYTAAEVQADLLPSRQKNTYYRSDPKAIAISPL